MAAPLYINSLGPDLKHVLPASWTIDSAGTPAPPQGNYWLKTTTTGNFNFATNGPAFPVRTFYWFCYRAFRVETALSAGDQFGIGLLAGSSMKLVGYSSGGTTWKVRLLDFDGVEVAIGATALAINTNYAIRAQLDGTNITIWVDNIQEIKVANTTKPTQANNGKTIAFGVDANEVGGAKTRKWRSTLFCASNDENDRPGTTVWIVSLDPNGNVTGKNDWSLQKFDNSKDATYTEWDDYTGGNVPDDDTTYNGAQNDVERIQLSNLTTATIPTSLNLIGVLTISWVRANTGGKTVSITHRLEYSTNNSEIGVDNIVETTYATRRANITDAPGGTWSQTVLDSLQYGLRQPTGNNAHVACSAIGIEVCAVDAGALAKIIQINQAVNRANTY